MKRSRLLVANILFVLSLSFVSAAQAKKPPQPPGPGPANATPVIELMIPLPAEISTGVNMGFTAAFSDADGWQNLSGAELIVDTNTNRRQCCYVRYDQNANLLYLRSDNNKNWMGGYAPGTVHTVENGQVTLDCSASSVLGNGTTLRVTWALAFKDAYAGLKNIYLFVEDDSGASQGWLSMGTCNIVIPPPDTTPPVGTISINGGAAYTNSPAVILSLSAQDEEGGSGVALMQFSGDGAAWSTPEAYAAARAWTLPAGDGTKTAYVRFADAAGNWSSSYADAIILDTTPPQIEVSSPREGEVIN